jgi:hypothetical protein
VMDSFVFIWLISTFLGHATRLSYGVGLLTLRPKSDKEDQGFIPGVTSIRELADA